MKQPALIACNGSLRFGAVGYDIAKGHGNMQYYLKKWVKVMFSLMIAKFIIPPASTKLKGRYTGFTLSVCLSVCSSIHLSVCGQNRVFSVSSTILVGSISYLHILSSNFRRCVVYKVLFIKIETLGGGGGGYPQNAVVLVLSNFIILARYGV